MHRHVCIPCCPCIPNIPKRQLVGTPGKAAPIPAEFMVTGALKFFRQRLSAPADALDLNHPARRHKSNWAAWLHSSFPQLFWHLFECCPSVVGIVPAAKCGLGIMKNRLLHHHNLSAYRPAPVPAEPVGSDIECLFDGGSKFFPTFADKVVVAS